MSRDEARTEHEDHEDRSAASRELGEQPSVDAARPARQRGPGAPGPDAEPDPGARARSAAMLRAELGPAPRAAHAAAPDEEEDADADAGDHNAYMTARAYDEAGRLLDLWVGPAYFHGEMPASYHGKRHRDRWRWSRDGTADATGGKLKVDSDRQGESGVPVGEWAPPGAAVVTVSFRGLSQPFGGRVVVDPDAPLSRIGVMEGGVADGAEPADLDAPGVFHGPREAGSVHESGDLTIEQTETGTRLWFGSSMMEVQRRRPGDDYAFTVQAQTSPNQRVVDIVGTPGVEVFLDNHDEGPQLVYHLRQVEPGQVPAQHPEALFAEGVMPAITALGDELRCLIMMGDDRIHIEAVEPDARFAYFVDPEWSGEHGEERAVHIVATPGVRVDEVRGGTGASAGADADGRSLLANPIYVQDPARVPKQGTPIDPADYVGATQMAYGRADNERVAVYTGTQGVTVRDALYGLTVSIEVSDPAIGGRFAWHLERPDGGLPGAFRALVGPGVLVHVLELHEPRPHEPALPADGFGITIDLHHTDDGSRIPPQGTPLTADLVSAFPARAPDSVAYKDPISDEERVGMAVVDVVMGVLPGAEAIDMLEALSGEDKWGVELSTLERVVVGVAALLPLLPGAIAKVGRFAKATLRGASELSELAARLGKTTEEVEYLLTRLRGVDPEAHDAARRVKSALQRGDLADPADLRLVNDALDRAGVGRVAVEPGAGKVGVVGGDADVVARIDGDTPGAEDLGGVRRADEVGGEAERGTRVEAGRRRGKRTDDDDFDDDLVDGGHANPSRSTGDAAATDGPYQDPRVHEGVPRRALDRRELDPVRRLGLVDSWRTIDRLVEEGRSVAIGRRLRTPESGHEVIERLARGDSSALGRLGLEDVPSKLDTTMREWALVEARDGYVVYVGAHDHVQLPAAVRPLAHSHPAPSAAAEQAGARTTRDLPTADDAVGTEFTALVEDLPKSSAMSAAGLLPSGADIQAISDGSSHVIYTRFVHRGEGRIANPSIDDAAPRVALHLENTRVLRWHRKSLEYIFESTMTVKDSAGQIIWHGPLYTRWRAQSQAGITRVMRPRELDEPAIDGWEDVQ